MPIAQALPRNPAPEVMDGAFAAAVARERKRLLSSEVPAEREANAGTLATTARAVEPSPSVASVPSRAGDGPAAATLRATSQQLFDGAGDRSLASAPQLAAARRDALVSDIGDLIGVMKSQALAMNDRLRVDNAALDATSAAVERNAAHTVEMNALLQEESKQSFMGFCNTLLLLALAVVLFAASYACIRFLPPPGGSWVSHVASGGGIFGTSVWLASSWLGWVRWGVATAFTSAATIFQLVRQLVLPNRPTAPTDVVQAGFAHPEQRPDAWAGAGRDTRQPMELPVQRHDTSFAGAPGSESGLAAGDHLPVTQRFSVGRVDAEGADLAQDAVASGLGGRRAVTVTSEGDVLFDLEAETAGVAAEPAPAAASQPSHSTSALDDAVAAAGAGSSEHQGPAESSEPWRAADAPALQQSEDAADSAAGASTAASPHGSAAHVPVRLSGDQGPTDSVIGFDSHPSDHLTDGGMPPSGLAEIPQPGGVAAEATHVANSAGDGADVSAASDAEGGSEASAIPESIDAFVDGGEQASAVDESARIHISSDSSLTASSSDGAADVDAQRVAQGASSEADREEAVPGPSVATVVAPGLFDSAMMSDAGVLTAAVPLKTTVEGSAAETAAARLPSVLPLPSGSMEPAMPAAHQEPESLQDHLEPPDGRAAALDADTEQLTPPSSPISSPAMSIVESTHLASTQDLGAHFSEDGTDTAAALSTASTATSLAPLEDQPVGADMLDSSTGSSQARDAAAIPSSVAEDRRPHSEGFQDRLAAMTAPGQPLWP